VYGSPFRAREKLTACVARVSGGHRPRLVDLARYRGQRAVVIMVPGPGGRLEVWAVGAGCSGTASDVLGHAVLPAGG
jgi:hypothetical protein